MDIHHIHIYWTSVIYINYGHPHCGFQNIWFLSYMTDIYHIWRTLTLYDCHHHLLSNSNSDPYTLLSGPSLASKPLQEHKLIIMMELHHCWLSSTLLFIFQIKIYNCKIDTSHSKMELLEPSGKVWYRPHLGWWKLHDDNNGGGGNLQVAYKFNHQDLEKAKKREKKHIHRGIIL